MRKMFRTLVFGVVIAAPLVLAPHHSRAGDHGDKDKQYDQGDKDKDKHDDDDQDQNGQNDQNGQGDNDNYQGDKDNSWSAGTPGTSVPLNQGTVFLMIAGLGLGIKMIYDRRKQVENSVI